LPGFSREWEKKRLGDVVNLQGGYSFQSNKFQKSGVPIIRISNIYEKLISLEVLVYYPSIKIPNEFIIKKGDVLIAMSGATTGKAGVYNYSFSSYQNQRVGKFVVCDLSKNDNGYIAQLVQSDLFLAGLKKEIAQGAQPNISGKQIESIELDFPLEINEQKAIAELLSNMDSDINLLELKLKKYKQIKIGMMQQLLTGKIRIYDKQKS
jgi:type I restriction enzyme S subunit